MNYIILYNKYKNQYKKKEINKVNKQAEVEQEDLEEILEDFDDLPQDRKIKKLKKLNENFKKLKVIYLKKDLNFLNKLVKIKFVKRYNLIKIYKFKLKNRYFFAPEKIIKNKEKNFEIKSVDNSINKNFFLNLKKAEVNINKNEVLSIFFFEKKKYLNLLKQRRKDHSFYNNYKKNSVISKVSVLYSRFEND